MVARGGGGGPARGDLSLAEDCAQEACAAALEQWPHEGLPANPGGWVVAVARRRALDHLRRESARTGKGREAMQEWAAEPDGSAVAGDDQLALLFACCHPALDPASRVTLTLRVVCGLPTASISRLLLLPEPAVAQRAAGPMPQHHRGAGRLGAAQFSLADGSGDGRRD